MNTIPTVIALFFLSLSTFGADRTPHAGGGNNGKCPDLAGKYEENTSHSPMVITENTEGNVITYSYGSGGGPGSPMIADGVKRPIDGADGIRTREHRVVLQIVRPGVRVAGVVRCHPVGAQVDTQPSIVVDRVLA